jgi:uncharacterized membrane protein
MDNRLSKLMIALVVIGLLVSIYMTIYKITSNDNMCIGSKDCAVVNASRYSELYGIPVAVFGVAGYAVLLAILLLERQPGFFQQNGTMLLFGISLVGFLFTVYLIFVEVALIKAFCPFCIASQTAMTVIFILSVVRLIRQP